MDGVVSWRGAHLPHVEIWVIFDGRLWGVGATKTAGVAAGVGSTVSWWRAEGVGPGGRALSAEGAVVPMVEKGLGT